MTEPNAGQELAAIARDLRAATEAWTDTGAQIGTPEDDAREAVFTRLQEWNRRYAK